MLALTTLYLNESQQLHQLYIQNVLLTVCVCVNQVNNKLTAVAVFVANDTDSVEIDMSGKLFN